MHGPETGIIPLRDEIAYLFLRSVAMVFFFFFSDRRPLESTFSFRRVRWRGLTIRLLLLIHHHLGHGFSQAQMERSAYPLGQSARRDRDVLDE